MNDLNFIQVTSAKVIKETDVSELTKLQKLVCKLFKIKPSCKHIFVVRIESPQIDSVDLTNILINRNEELWVVMKIGEGYFDIINHKPMHHLLLGDNFVNLSTACP